jgi:hypothetical protein
MRSHSSYYDYSSVQRNVTGSRALVTITRPATTSARCFQNSYLVRICRRWSPFLNVSMCSSTVHLADTFPHSSTTLAYESITHTSIISSTQTIYTEADHALTCACRLLLFPVVNLAHITSRFLIPFFSHDALHPTLHHRRLVMHSSPVSMCQPLAIIFPLSKHHPRPIIICPRWTTGLA